MNIATARLAKPLVVFAFSALALPLLAEPRPLPFPFSEEPADAHSRLPQLISHVAAVCPPVVAIEAIEEDVHVAFVVDSTGSPVKVRAFFSHHAELEKPAEEAVKQWKFSPGIHQGRTVNTQMVVAVHFAPPAKTT